MKYDAIIVGGGPSGLLSAHRIARAGHRVLVLEEHKEIGIPDHCAGLISNSGMKRLGIRPPKDVVQNSVIGARIFSPSCHALSVERGKREALVVNRQGFDKWLSIRAEDAGVEIRRNSSVREIAFKDRRYMISYRGEGETYVESSRVVLNAEGSRGVISKKLGLPQIPKSSKLPAYQFEVSGIDLEEDFVEMFYGRQISQGFFSWIIPLGEGRARVGIASKDRAKQRLQRAMKKHQIISKNLHGMRIERGFGGVVLVGLPLSRTTKGGAISLGDAAGMVKATTGGGVVVGGVMAQLAGAYIARSLEDQVPDIQLKGFDGIWKTHLLRELQSMYLAQRALTSLSDKGLDLIVERADQYGLLEIVKEEGDMDMQRKVIQRLLRNPRMILLGLQAIRYLNPF